MKKADMQTYQDRLLALRARLRGDVDHLAESALKSGNGSASNGHPRMPIHMADIGSENYEQEFTLSLMANEESTLEAIETSLQRIRDGIYGTCEQCQGKINKSRLNAIPYTSLCIKCAESQERG